MPRYPDNVVGDIFEDGDDGEDDEDDGPRPEQPGFFGRMYNAIMGVKPADAPLRRSTDFRTADDDDYVPAETPSKAWTAEEDDDDYLKGARAARGDRGGLRYDDGESQVDDGESQVDDGDFQDDEEVPDAPMSGGGRTALGNAALVMIVLAMTALQS